MRDAAARARAADLAESVRGEADVDDVEGLPGF